MLATAFVTRRRWLIIFLSALTVLLLAYSFIYAQTPDRVAAQGASPIPGAAPESKPVLDSRPTSGQIGEGFSGKASSLSYTTFTYTHSDLLIFSYNDGTSIEVYDANADLIWSGILDASQHAALTPGAGIFRVLGSAPYSICVGDELTSFVLGYYAVDQYGRGLNTRLYTYQSSWSWAGTDPHFIVFAYEDGSDVQVVDTETGLEIWSGTLNAGEHYDNTTLSGNFLTVTSSKPVAALSYTDQGYYVPSENGTFMGIRFYTYIGNAGAWAHSLNIVAYNDETSVEVRYTSTGDLIWSGVLNNGSVQSILGLNSSFVTVTSDKGIAVNASPYGAFPDGYYHSLYGQDSTGTGIGKHLYFPVISGGRLIVFSYEAASQVTITDSDGLIVWAGVLNAGEVYSLITANTVYTIDSTGYTSVLFDWGDLAGADFAPVFYGGGPPLSRGSISLLASDFYQQYQPIYVSAMVDNPGATTTTYTVIMSLLQNDVVIQSFSMDIAVPPYSCVPPISFEFDPLPGGNYALVADLYISAENLDSEWRYINVLDPSQVLAAVAAQELTDRALAELNQTHGIAVDVLSDGIKRAALDPNKWAAEKVLQYGGETIAVYFGATPGTVAAINNAIKLTMAGVKKGFSGPVGDVSREVAEEMVDEALEGRSGEIQDKEHGFIVDVAGEQFTWNGQMEFRTQMEDFAIGTVVEVKPFFSVNGLPPFVRYTSFLGEYIEYLSWEELSWIVSAILLVLAAAVVISFILGLFSIAPWTIIVHLAAAASEYALVLKVVGLINAVVVPIMMLTAAVSMVTTAQDHVAPAIVETHGGALDGLFELIQGSLDNDVVSFETQVDVDAYQVSLLRTISNSSTQTVTPFVETYIYRVDGSLLEILPSQPRMQGGESQTWKQQLDLPAGEYRAITVLYSHDETAVRVQDVPFEVTVPAVRMQASFSVAQVSLGESVNANITLANTDLISSTGELTLFAIATDGQNFDSWSVNLPPAGSQDFSYRFAPQAEGGYVLKLSLTDGKSVLAKRDLSYAVGQSAALAINAGYEATYSPDSDITVPITATNAGNLSTTAVLTLLTLSAQDEYNIVYTTSVTYTVEGNASEAVLAEVLPDAQPGTYLTRLLLDDHLYDSFEFSVEAVDTLFAHIAPDTFFHAVNDNVVLSVQVENSSYAYTDADPIVTIQDPNGASHQVSMSPIGTGQYQGNFTAPITGTYVADVDIAESGYRVVADTSFFTADRANALVPNVVGELFQGQVNPLTVTVTTETGLPVSEATVILSGTQSVFSAVTGSDGKARLSVSSQYGDELYYATARKVGYLNASFKLPVVPVLDTDSPFISLDSVFDGQFVNTSSITVSGSTEISATVTINGDPVTVDVTGNFAVPITLTEGANTFVTMAEDLAGNTTTLSTTIHLDTIAPILIVTLPPDGWETRSDIVNVVGSTEIGASISIGEYIIPVNSDGTFSAWLLLDLGSNSLSVIATDAAGNSTPVNLIVVRNPYNLYLPQLIK